MPAATQTFQLYFSLGSVVPDLTIQVPTAEMDDLQDAIRKGAWWASSTNPNDQRNFAGIARYVVTAP